MTLQSSGAISLANIAAEFGGSTPHSLSEYYGVASGIPSSGTISMSNFMVKQMRPMFMLLVVAFHKAVITERITFIAVATLI